MKLRDLVEFVGRDARLNGKDPMDVEVGGIGWEDVTLCMGRRWTLQIGLTESDKRRRERQLDELAAKVRAAVDDLRKAKG